MKNFNIIYLLFIIPILYGCTSAKALSGNLPSVTNSSAVIENTEETTEENIEVENQEVDEGNSNKIGNKIGFKLGGLNMLKEED